MMYSNFTLKYINIHTRKQIQKRREIGLRETRIFIQGIQQKDGISLYANFFYETWVKKLCIKHKMPIFDLLSI